MSFRKLLLLVLVIIIAQSFLFAQAEPDQTVTQQSATISTLDEINPFYSRVTPFLSDGEGSWVIMITKNGGLTGDYKLVAAINSDGNSVCEERDKFILNPLKQEIRLGLFETVGKQKFAEIKYQSGAKKEDYTTYCNDCYKTRMYIFERGEKSKFKTYTFNMNTPNTSDEAAAKLFGQVIDSYSCPPAPNN